MLRNGQPLPSLGGAVKKLVAGTLVALLTTCGSPGWEDAPQIAVGLNCQGDRMIVQIQSGARFTCSDIVNTLDTYRAAFEERWGHIDLGGRVVRIYATRYLTPADGGVVVGGVTYRDAIDLGSSMLVGFPHELHHIQLGPSSADHHGWCQDFMPWEGSELGFDDRLGCQCE